MSVARPADTPKNGPPAPQLIIPTCPHCRRGLEKVSWNTQSPQIATPGGPPMAFVLFFCPKCQTALNCQLLPVEFILSAQEVARIAEAQRSLIARPQG